MEELQDIVAGLDQRIKAYKTRLQELQKKRDRLEEEIKTIKKYLELAETLYRVEQEKSRVAAKEARSSGEIDRDRTRGVDEPDQSQEILLGRTKYFGMSVPQAAAVLLKEAGTPMHARELYRKLVEGGIRIRAKTPITSIAISLRRDKRFRKVAPNTFEFVAEASVASAEGADERG
ncbi:MAG: HTH domain-containing protein [Nitrospirota bacterium]